MAGKDWDEFLSALHLYRDDQLTLMAQAPPDKVHVMQGHARCAIDLCTHLDNCRDKARQIEDRITNARSER